MRIEKLDDHCPLRIDLSWTHPGVHGVLRLILQGVLPHFQSTLVDARRVGNTSGVWLSCGRSWKRSPKDIAKTNSFCRQLLNHQTKKLIRCKIQRQTHPIQEIAFPSEATSNKKNMLRNHYDHSRHIHSINHYKILYNLTKTFKNLLSKWCIDSRWPALFRCPAAAPRSAPPWAARWSRCRRHRSGSGRWWGHPATGPHEMA